LGNRLNYRKYNKIDSKTNRNECLGGAMLRVRYRLFEAVVGLC